jgi:hypothetical protein
LSYSLLLLFRKVAKLAGNNTAYYKPRYIAYLFLLTMRITKLVVILTVFICSTAFCQSDTLKAHDTFKKGLKRKFLKIITKH